MTARQLRVGDRLVANPCDVKVTRLASTGGLASGWCFNCMNYHVLDERLFNSGRGPWKREEI